MRVADVSEIRVLYPEKSAYLSLDDWRGLYSLSDCTLYTPSPRVSQRAGGMGCRNIVFSL